MERTIDDARLFRISWGAVIAGAVASLAIWLLLHVLGLGIGLIAIDPQNPGSLRSVGIGTGVWSLIAPLCAMFVGGVVAGRLAGPTTRVGGALHGLVLWALAVLLSTFLVMLAVRSVASGLAQATGQAVSTITKAARGDAASGDENLLSRVGLDADDLLAPINRRLRAEGKAEVTADQIGRATREVMATGLRTGHLDRDLLTRSLADNTALSRADAEEIATRVEQRFSEGVAGARETALRGAETAGKVFLGTFLAMLIGLLFAILGAMLGVSRLQRLAARPVTTVNMTPQPVT